jgi:hypothetical protein
MIKEIIAQWNENKGKLEDHFRTGHPGSYKSIVESLFKMVISGYDVERITVIDDGDYQGTQIFIIPENGYQPSVGDYIMTYSYYGSCSGCDTLQGISEYSSEAPTKEQVKDYMTLALHLVQKLRPLSPMVED